MRTAVLQICCCLALVCAALLPAQSTTVPVGDTNSAGSSTSVRDSLGTGSDKPAAIKSGKPKPGNSKVGSSKPANSKPANSKPGNSKALPGITPEREAAVMTFVKQHHPELAELLVHLKENTPKEYDRAVRDLFRTSERLAQVQERDSLTYDLELKLWKARSRAQLLAARLQMANSDELQKQLRATLNEEYDMRLQLLQRDRERLTERVRNLAEQFDKLSQRRDEEIEKQMKQLTSAARGGEVKVKSTAKKKDRK